MSGEITVTPGQTFTNEDVTPTRLNNLGAPSMAVGADQVGKRELNLPSVAGSVTPGRAWQLFRNANLAGPTWRDPSGVTAADGVKTDNAASWICLTDGADATYERGTLSPPDEYNNTEEVLYGAKITGATSMGVVYFGQYVPPEITRLLKVARTMTVSFGLYYNDNNQTAPTAASGLQVAVLCSATEGSGASVVERATSDTFSIFSEYSDYKSAVISTEGITDFENGALIALKIPSGELDAATKSMTIAAPRLEIAATASTWITQAEYDDQHGPAPLHNWQATADPDYTNDSTEGYSYGSRWRNSTDNSLWTCLNPKKDKATWVKLGQNNNRYGLYLYKQNSTTAGGDIKTSPTSADRIPWNTAAIVDDRAAELNGTDVELNAKGTYRIRAVQVCNRCVTAQLYHNGKTVQRSMNARSPSAGAYYTGLMRYDQVERITATPPVDVELVPIANTARSTDGLGAYANFSQPNIYGILEVEWLPEAEPSLSGVTFVGLIWDENVDLTNTTLESGPAFEESWSGGVLLLIGQDDPTENGAYSWDFGGGAPYTLTRSGSPYVASFYNKRAFIDRGGRGNAQRPRSEWRTVIQVATISTLDTDPMVFIEQDGYNCITITS